MPHIYYFKKLQSQLECAKINMTSLLNPPPSCSCNAKMKLRKVQKFENISILKKYYLEIGTNSYDKSMFDCQNLYLYILINKPFDNHCRTRE